MARDVGSYFERLTKKAKGGRRLDEADRAPTPTQHANRSDDRSVGSAPPSSPSSSSTSPASSGSSGVSGRSGDGLVDVLKDMLGKGRTAANKTTERVRATRQPKATPASRRRTLPSEGVVIVEYSPNVDGDPDPGEVVWAWVPFEEDPEQGKDRPVVVIGRRGTMLVGVPLTTKRSDREAQIAIGTGGWDPQRRQSYARIWRMVDLDEQSMRREGAILPRDRFDQVVAAVDEYYDVRRPTASEQSGVEAGADANFDYDY